MNDFKKQSRTIQKNKFLKNRKAKTQKFILLYVF